jgi:hypothetical protein
MLPAQDALRMFAETFRDFAWREDDRIRREGDHERVAIVTR